jgi:hypothetical protein
VKNFDLTHRAAFTIITISELLNPLIPKLRARMKLRAHRILNLLSAALSRNTISAIVAASLLVASGCGSEEQHSSTTTKYPAGISEDIEQQLKYDARVDSFEPDGNDLIVNVNDSWRHSPPGLRERALGQWYSLWQPAHGAASKILVKYEGNEIERWTAERGYQPAEG